MDKYPNRVIAGQILARNLQEYANRQDVLVLALPRGGVPVAFEVAKALSVPLDVFIVRKLGVPGHAELAMGAIAMGDAIVYNEDIINDLNIIETDLQNVIQQEKQELNRRQTAYRDDYPFPVIKNKIVILVDDGIATGATMRAAILALRKLEPKKIIIAVPVADVRIYEMFLPLVDSFVCPLKAPHLYAVGAWYEDFSQTEDAEVYTLLNKAHKLFSPENGT